MKFIYNLYKNAFSNHSKMAWVLSTVMFINRCGSMVILFASLYMINDLSISKVHTGYVMSAIGVGSILGSYVGGYLADKYNAKTIMYSSLLGSGLVLLLLPYLTNPWSIGILLFFYTLIADTFRPANAVALASVTTPQTRTKAFGLNRLAVNLGFSVAPALGGLLANKIGFIPLFIFDACTTIAASSIVFFAIKDVYKTKIESINDEIVETKSISAYKDKRFMWIILAVLLYGIGFFQLIASIPIYFNKELHFSEDTIGYLLALNGLIVVVAELPLITYLQQKTTVVGKWIKLGIILAVAAMLFLVLGNGSLPIVIAYIVFISASEIFAMPYLMTYVTNYAPLDRQGQYTALYSMAYAFAIIVAPIIGLSLSAYWGFKNSYLLSCGILVFSLVLIIRFFKIKKQ